MYLGGDWGGGGGGMKKKRKGSQIILVFTFLACLISRVTSEECLMYTIQHVMNAIYNTFIHTYMCMYTCELTAYTYAHLFNPLPFSCLRRFDLRNTTSLMTFPCPGCGVASYDIVLSGVLSMCPVLSVPVVWEWDVEVWNKHLLSNLCIWVINWAWYFGLTHTKLMDLETSLA